MSIQSATELELTITAITAVAEAVKVLNEIVDLLADKVEHIDTRLYSVEVAMTQLSRGE